MPDEERNNDGELESTNDSISDSEVPHIAAFRNDFKLEDAPLVFYVRPRKGDPVRTL